MHHAEKYVELSLGGVERNVKAFHGAARRPRGGTMRAPRHAAPGPADKSGLTVSPSPLGGEGTDEGWNGGSRQSGENTSP